jgi:hypothetical protein
MQSISHILSILLQVSNLIVFAELGQAKLKGLGQADNKLITSSGTPMEYYKLSDLTATEEIAFQITGFNVNTSGFTTWVILSLTFGVLIVFVFLRLLRRGACS